MYFAFLQVFIITPKLQSSLDSSNPMAASSSRPASWVKMCQWPEGCNKHARSRGFCQQHAAQHSRMPSLALLRPKKKSRPAPDLQQDAPNPVQCQAAAASSSSVPHAVPRSAAAAASNPQNPAVIVTAHCLDTFTDAAMLTLTFGSLNKRCQYCDALFFPAERGSRGQFSLCCKNGKVAHLPAVADAPEPLRSYLRGSDAASRNFRQVLQRYNSAMSFISFGVNLEVKRGSSGNQVPPVCIVHGAVYHHSYDLRAEAAELPKYAQFYLYDANEATALRAARHPGLEPHILSELANMLDLAGNPYVQAYRRMGELTNNLDPRAARQHLIYFIVLLLFFGFSSVLFLHRLFSSISSLSGSYF